MNSEDISTASAKPPVPTLAHYRSLCTIRSFERLVLEHFGSGRLRGTTHTYIGQEAIAVAAMHFIRPEDRVVSNHRCHGHYLAYCGDADGLLAEIAGLGHGICGGIGGSQHLHRDGFFSNGVLGGMVPISVGLALADKLRARQGVVVCFMGDGTLGEGVVYESFNMASLWQVPVLFVIENNRYAQSTPIEKNLAGWISDRVASFDIETGEIESNDIADLLVSFEYAFTRVRTTGRPFCQVIHTYRMGPHSKGDDFRPESELAAWADRDPLLLAKRYIPGDVADSIAYEVDDRLRDLFQRTIGSQDGAATTAIALDQGGPTRTFSAISRSPALYSGAPVKLVHHLNRILRHLFAERDDIILLGEDIEDPYGGAFKVTKDLSSQFSSRVFSTPVSEAAIVGVANGLALYGFRPIVEIMFGDFTTLIVDQVVNHMTKFYRMYNGRSSCPVIIRTPMGGYRGYGPTHSQSIEKLFLGIPGLAVVACDTLHDQERIWRAMITSEQPCLYIENKSLYSQNMKACIDGRVEHFRAETLPTAFPITTLQLESTLEPDLAFIAYGGMVPLALSAARALFESDERIARVVVPTQIAPLDGELLRTALDGCRRIIVIEEGTRRNGWGAEVGALLLETVGSPIAFRRVAARDTIIPSAAEPEQAVLPSLQDCLRAAREVANAI
jgi:2-oxoisovalerate dehydrogenase E1 component